MANTNCLEGCRCPTCGNEASFRVVGSTCYLVTDDGTDFGADVEYDSQSAAFCTECDWQGRWGELRGEIVPDSATPNDVADIVRWFDELRDIIENNPADVTSWIANGADRIDLLRCGIGRT